MQSLSRSVWITLLEPRPQRKRDNGGARSGHHHKDDGAGQEMEQCRLAAYIGVSHVYGLTVPRRSYCIEHETKQV